MLRRLLVHLLTVCVFAATVPGLRAETPASFEGLDEFIAGVMGEWKVPGLAIAVVRDGEIILSKGYGYRDLEKKRPVTPRTLFAIGSITKSFTVSDLGMLADEGKVNWDAPVRDYLPGFELQDPVATLGMTPRDLVTHRSGLPRHDGLWYGSPLTREQLFQRLRYLEPSKEFRSTYQYQNLMFMTAGYLVGKVSGSSWEGFTKKRILEPLDMTSSNFSVEDSQKAEDFALPYDINDQKEVERVDYRNLDKIGPAGSINSNVEEMIRYVQFHINKGKHGEKQLLSESNAEQMQTPQMVIQSAIEYDELGHSAYGMGLGITAYRGHKVVQHGGGIDGFIALLSFMPLEKMGMIVLTNLSGNNPVPTIVSRNVYDRLLGMEPVPWEERIREAQAKAEKAEEEAEQKGYVARKEGTSPTHPLSDYAGMYEHPGYGSIQVELKGEALSVQYNGMSSPLELFHYDIFETPEDSVNVMGGVKMTFFYDKKGDIDRLAVPLEPSVDDIVFHRVADPSMRERGFLEPFVGEYELADTILTISLRRDDTLVLSVPGQLPYELVPKRGTLFDAKDLRGFSIEFKRDASGAVIEAAVYQPQGTFVAKKK